MTYGNYKYVLPAPDGYDRAEWQVYAKTLKEMANWISDQKWDHWGSYHNDDGKGFYFNVEENYMMFLLRWT